MPIPIHMDPMIPLTVPEDVKARLRKNESGQRSRVKAINKRLIKANNMVKSADQIDLLIIEKVDIIAIGDEQNWTCGCNDVPGWNGCYQRVDITKKGNHSDAPVIGHVIATGRGGNHTASNVRIMRHRCNQDLNFQIEATDIAKTNRLRRKHKGLNRDGTQHTKKTKKVIPARPEGLKSRSSWGNQKRKLQSRNTLRKKT